MLYDNTHLHNPYALVRPSHAFSPSVKLAKQAVAPLKSPHPFRLSPRGLRSNGQVPKVYIMKKGRASSSSGVPPGYALGFCSQRIQTNIDRPLDSTINPSPSLAWARDVRDRVRYVRLHEDTGDTVGVSVAGGPAVLEVTAALGRDLARNADRRRAVGNAAVVG
jgi:hypothetical protein